jgi:murein DD-endopeptidase MepM/ murein hydrolase activator NlpD
MSSWPSRQLGRSRSLNCRIPHFPNFLILWLGLLIPISVLTIAGQVSGQSPTGDEVTPTPTPTTAPFLHPPFAGRYRVTSYFDHHHPDRAWDDTIVIFNGDQASAIDGILGRTATFRGGYRFPDAAWYIYYDGHNGIDYGTPKGVTILAAAPGEVVFAGSIPTSCDTPLQYVTLEHANGYRTYYLHLEGICVRQGEWVEAGDPLGLSGNSGCSTGPHLHFSVEREWLAIDPYGWQPEGRPDPIIAYRGAPATWLWAADEPSDDVLSESGSTSALTGTLVDPPPEVATNGDLSLRFVPDEGTPPLARVEFLAYYADAGAAAPRWHSLGADEEGSDGWSRPWDTRGAPEGEVWLHAWATGADGRVGKGSPIRTDITVDRHPPLGYVVGLEPGSTAGARLWLYAASYDPDSTAEHVTFLVRQHTEQDDTEDQGPPSEGWYEIGDARRLHADNAASAGDWLLEWEPTGIADGARIDVAARLIDRAGNTTWTQAVEDVTIERSALVGQLISPASGIPFTTTLDLRFLPLVVGEAAEEAAPIERVAFYVWHDGAWHLAGVDRYGDDGWSVAWDPRRVADQRRMRVQARVYDAEGQVNTALPQATDLTLDRTPPSAGYIRPRGGGVARPDVEQTVWAWDGGSGVARVEFYVDDGRGWFKIGEDDAAEEGWMLSAPWDSPAWASLGVTDGSVDFCARVYDRAGNERWTEAQRAVALDRGPPQGEVSFPLPGMRLSGTVTVTLEVTDTVSGLDRAIFYARYGDRWQHLGVGTAHEDGLGLAWDTAAWSGQEGVTLTAWVYDRAGNVLELPHVEGLAVGPASTPTATGTPSATPPPTALPPTASRTPEATIPPRVTSPTDTPQPPTDTPLLPPDTPLLSAPTVTSTPMPATTGRPIHPAFWYLVGGGALVAGMLLFRTLRALKPAN